VAATKVEAKEVVETAAADEAVTTEEVEGCSAVEMKVAVCSVGLAAEMVVEEMKVAMKAAMEVVAMARAATVASMEAAAVAVARGPDSAVENLAAEVREEAQVERGKSRTRRICTDRGSS
jgi:hypothetical protein